jgi:hypothetical protein
VKYESARSTYTVTRADRTSLDSKALKSEKPEIFDAYVRTTTTYTLKAMANKEE